MRFVRDYLLSYTYISTNQNVYKAEVYCECEYIDMGLSVESFMFLNKYISIHISLQSYTD